ncbi:hypothetical protein [Streptomyces sp. NBC_00009]
MSWATAVGREDAAFPLRDVLASASRLPALDERLTGIAVTMF